MRLKTFFIDLDDTLYSSNTGIWDRIRERMGLYMQERLYIPAQQVPELRRQFYTAYGTTMRGLELVYGIDIEEYLIYVHDVPIEDCLSPDPALREMLLSYPQRKLIFTNADWRHAERVLAALNLRDCFEEVIDIHRIAPACKPQPEAFRLALLEAGEPDPSACLMADDSPQNIQAAREAGFYTILVGSREPNPVADATLLTLKELPSVLPVSDRAR